MPTDIRRHVPTMIVAMVTAAVTAGAPALAAAVAEAVNADTVDRKHAVGAAATPAQRAGKLVATNSSGRLPNDIIVKAPNADKLDNVDVTGIWKKTETSKLRARNFAATSGSEADMADGTCVSYPNLLLTVQAPRPGVIQVSGHVQMKINNVNGSGSSAKVAIGTSNTDCSDALGASAGVVVLPSTLPTGVYYHTLPVSRTFTVPAGTYSFYANGYGTSSARYFYGSLNATFFPTG